MHDLMTAYVCLTVCGIAVTACRPREAEGSGRSDQVAAEGYRVPTLNLTGRELAAATDLRLPLAIAVIGKRLLVVDSYGDSIFKLLDRETGKEVIRFGRRGSLLDDFMAPVSLEPVPGDSLVWTYDMELGRFSLLQLIDNHVAVSAVIRRRVNLAVPNVFRAAWIGQHTIVGQGLPEGGRIARFDSTGALSGMIGAEPGNVRTEPALIRQQAYKGVVVANGSKTKFVLALRHADILALYDSAGKLLADADRPFGFEPSYDVIPGPRPRFITKDDMRYGYVNAAATDHLVLALFSGRVLESYKSRAAFGNQVLVFDWDGRLRSVLRLKSDAIAIAVTPDGDRLYTVGGAPPHVVVYDLPTMATLGVALTK